MISNNGKDLSYAEINGRALFAIYLGDKLLWVVVSSCFGSGYWNNDLAWDDDDCWVN